MADKDHVIATLEYCLAHGSMGWHDCWVHCDEKGNLTNSNSRDNCSNKDCTTGCVITLIREAVELLKSQRPRVMTLKEACDSKVCWAEWRGKWAPVMQPCEVFDYGIEVKIQCFGDRSYHEDGKGYGNKFRFWTSRPTKEQREAMKWERE